MLGSEQIAYFNIGANKLTDLDMSDCPLINFIGISKTNILHIDFSDKENLRNMNADGISREISLFGRRFDMKNISEDFDMSRTRNWTNAEVDGSIITVTDTTKAVTYEYDVHVYNPIHTYTEMFTLIPIPGVPEIVGDVNADAKADIHDLIILKRYLLLSETESLKDKSQADISGDGKINVMDFALMKKWIM